MIELLIDGLKLLGVNPGAFRIVDYITFRVVMAALTALVIELVFGHALIVRLYRRRFRDTGGEFSSLDQHSKRGTPTGGGLIILLAVAIAIALWGRLTNYHLLVVGAAFGYFGLVGFIDDFQKVRLKSSLFGLSQLAKTVLQLAFIVPYALWFVSGANILPKTHHTQVFVPFVKNALFDAGPLLFALFIVFVFFSIVNAVNITDGLDGLVCGPAIMTTLIYGIFAYVLGNVILSRYLLFPSFPGVGELAVFAGALIGALFGFLWYNAYPAEVFMGDTGSMAIGAALATLAFQTRQEMLFPLVGGVFVASIATSLIQEKLGMRFGRRIFLRAPLHHAQTYKGVAEPKVVTRTWIVAIMLALLAALSLKLR